MPPHLAHTVAYCALCRGDLVEVVDVLEDQLERYGGVGDSISSRSASRRSSSRRTSVWVATTTPAT